MCRKVWCVWRLSDSHRWLDLIYNSRIPPKTIMILVIRPTTSNVSHSLERALWRKEIQILLLRYRRRLFVQVQCCLMPRPVSKCWVMPLSTDPNWWRWSSSQSVTQSVRISSIMENCVMRVRVRIESPKPLSIRVTRKKEGRGNISGRNRLYDP